MDDLISRQAAIEIASDLRDCISVEGYWAWAERIKRLPPEDVAEVVRCKDYIWRYHDVIDGEETDWCGVWANQTQENAFCSYGKRAK